MMYDYNCCFDASFIDKLNQCYNKIIELCNRVYARENRYPDTIYVGNRKFYGMLDKKGLNVFIKDNLTYNEIQVSLENRIVGSLIIKNLPEFK